MSDMMIAQHTPGPWYIDAPMKAYAHSISVPAKNPIYRIRIAEIPETFNAAGEPVAEANARLIAAAPKLLTALKALTAEVELRDNPRDQGCDVFCPAMIAAATVIAEAEGRS